MQVECFACKSSLKISPHVLSSSWTYAVCAACDEWLPVRLAGKNSIPPKFQNPIQNAHELAAEMKVRLKASPRRIPAQPSPTESFVSSFQWTSTPPLKVEIRALQAEANPRPEEAVASPALPATEPEVERTREIEIPRETLLTSPAAVPPPFSALQQVAASIERDREKLQIYPQDEPAPSYRSRKKRAQSWVGLVAGLLGSITILSGYYLYQEGQKMVRQARFQELLKIEPNQDRITHQASLPQREEPKLIEIGPARATLRSGPGTDHLALGLVEPHQKFRLIQTQENWTEIEVPVTQLFQKNKTETAGEGAATARVWIRSDLIR